MSRDILIDSHAHLHDFVSISAFLSQACLNFRNCGKVSNFVRFVGFLCLADFLGADSWKRLEAAVVSKSDDYWRLVQLDAVTISAKSESRDRIYLIAGRQVKSSEGLEVLALGIKAPITSGMPLAKLLSLIDELGGLAILPWGSGKWWGRRGRVIEETIRSSKPVCYGDNGGRPWLWKPKLLKLAAEHGLPIVPGSDPLPIKQDCLRNGSYGLKTSEALADKDPATWLFNILSSTRSTTKRFGKDMGVWTYAYRQLQIRIK